jgi:xanthine dehydrogenase YagS FAD-binding subunit
VQPFEFIKATNASQAVALADSPGAQFLAGGTNLVDLMKGGVAQPQRLIDVTGLPLSDIEPLGAGGIRIGAMVRNSDAANHLLIRQQYPLLCRAFLSGASPQLRNMATVGGNLLQRTRCPYFTDIGFDMCNKRKAGSGCGALEGYNRMHAILGASDTCVATNPSDMCVGLVALDATVRILGRHSTRTVPIGEFHRLPGTTPQLDSNLQHGELILGVDLPQSPFAEHSTYLKIRDRASYAFALVSVAVGLQLEGSMVRDCRIAMGGVAHKPWRARGAEAVLRGASLTDGSIAAAAAASVAGARPLEHNAFKLPLARRVVARAIRLAAGTA